MTLQALIQKMKEAGGPDRELDGLIAWHLCGVREQVMSANKRWDVELFPEETQLAVYLAICRSCETERPYTSSIDCALSLVPEGWGISGFTNCMIDPKYGDVRSTTGWSVVCARIGESFAGRIEAIADLPGGRAPTPALALCIAALEARQKMKEAM